MTVFSSYNCNNNAQSQNNLQAQQQRVNISMDW